MNAFEEAMVKFAKQDLVATGGLNLDNTFPLHVIRKAWAQARVVLGV
jgi:hypothetical protein